MWGSARGGKGRESEGKGSVDDSNMHRERDCKLLQAYDLFFFDSPLFHELSRSANQLPA